MRPRIAIVGAGGFVGSRLIEMAALGGTAEIVPIVRSLSGAARLARFGIDCRIGDANTLDGISSAIAGCDVVVNLTAGDPRRLLSQVKNIYAACKRQGTTTLVHVSSAVVFGPEGLPCSDDGAAQNSHQPSLYAREKARAERFLESARGGTSLVTLRPGLIWGPRSPWVIGPLTALANGTAFLAANGSGICNLIYVDNLIDSLLAVACHRSPKPGFYNVADDRVMTWREYYGFLALLIGRDIDDVTDIGDVNVRPTFASHLQQLKETWWLDILKRRLKSQTKLKIKQSLEDLQARFLTRGTALRPAISREIWMLQRARHSPPTDRFVAAFGHCNHVDFDTALHRTAHWAAYAGFAEVESDLNERFAHADVRPALEEVAAATTPSEIS